MRFFSRRGEQNRPRLLTATPGDLTRIGRTAFGGQDPHPPGISAISVAELDGYVMAAMEASGCFSPGAPEWEPVIRQFLDELTAAAERAGDWGFVGAFCVATNFVTSEGQQDPRFLAIVDRALTVLRDDGVAYPSIPEFALRRWDATHPSEGLGRAAWPSALEDVSVPPLGSEPPVIDLGDGESRELARRQINGAPNSVYAQRRADDAVVAVIDGVDASDGVRKHWEWTGLNKPDYLSFLRELGERLVTPTPWAHEDLEPYFPCRPRSRDQMRIEARDDHGGELSG
jgi:hypothetical protein